MCFGCPTGQASMGAAEGPCPSLPSATTGHAGAWNDTRSSPRGVAPSGEHRLRTGAHPRVCAECLGPNAFSLPWDTLVPPVLAHHERHPGGCVALSPARAARLARAPTSCTACRRLAVPTPSPRVLVGLAGAVATAAPPPTLVCRRRRHRPQDTAAPRASGYDVAGLGPREFARYIADEMVSRAELVRVSGAKLD